MLLGADSPAYKAQVGGTNGYFNGAYYYAREIEANIVPRISTARDWVLLNVKGLCWDGAIVFIHNNLHPERYSWLSSYRDLILVCGIPETVPMVSHLGTAIYLPLSVDVAYVGSFAGPKDRDACYVGRRSKLRMSPVPEDVDLVCGMERSRLLSELSRYRRAYAVGRCAIEAKVLGCDVLPFDRRFPDPSRWRVLDNADAAGILQARLDEIDR